MMTTPKILQVIDKLDVGGAERVFVDLSNLLYDAGAEVTALFLLSEGTLGKALDAGVPRIELNRRSKTDISAMRKAARIAGKFDIVHCHTRHVYRYMKLVQKVFRFDSEVLLHDHSSRINGRVPFMLNGFLRPTSYVGVSSEIVEWAKDELSVPPDRSFLLENIVIKQDSLQNGTKRDGLVLVSNFRRPKNIDFALKHMAGLGSPLHLIGGVNDREYFEECRSLSKSWEEIEFMTDVASIQPLLSNYKVGLHTSKRETGPLVLIEYLAQELPFLAFETGEISRILRPEFPEFFIDNFDPAEWNERTKELLENEPDKEKMRTVFSRFFSSEAYSRKCLEIYKSISS